MRLNDGKNKFYRFLELDEDTKKFLKSYRQIKKIIMDEPEERNRGHKIVKET